MWRNRPCKQLEKVLNLRINLVDTHKNSFSQYIPEKCNIVHVYFFSSILATFQCLQRWKFPAQQFYQRIHYIQWKFLKFFFCKNQWKRLNDSNCGNKWRPTEWQQRLFIQSLGQQGSQPPSFVFGQGIKSRERSEKACIVGKKGRHQGCLSWVLLAQGTVRGLTRSRASSVII